MIHGFGSRHPYRCRWLAGLAAALAVSWGCQKQTVVTPPPSAGGTVYCTADGTLGPVQPVQSHRSYCIKSDAAGVTYQPDVPGRYTFVVMDDRGEALKDFAVVHEKIMHVIVVRQDLAEFQHIHPEFNRTTGAFTLADLTLPSDGPYRLFADFTPSGSPRDPHGNQLPVTIHEDLAGGDLSQYTAQPLTDITWQKTVAGYTVDLSVTSQPIQAFDEVRLSFAIRRDGVAVTDTERYLGARGHAVILSEGKLDFLHTHPREETGASNRIEFDVTFPRDGQYKVFMQFQHQGQVITSDFVLTVTPGPSDQDNTRQPSAGHPARPEQ